MCGRFYFKESFLVVGIQRRLCAFSFRRWWVGNFSPHRSKATLSLHLSTSAALKKLSWLAKPSSVLKTFLVVRVSSTSGGYTSSSSCP